MSQNFQQGASQMKRDLDLYVEQRREAIDELAEQTFQQILADMQAPPTLEGVTDLLERNNINARRYNCEKALDLFYDMLPELLPYLARLAIGNHDAEYMKLTKAQLRAAAKSYAQKAATEAVDAPVDE
jgi:hypothetical protein